MASLDASAEAVAAIAERLRGLIDLADALKGMASVEQTIREREADLVNATARLAEMNQRIADTQNNLNAAEAAHGTRIAATNEAVNVMLADAKVKADGIFKDARHSASMMVETAKNDVAGLRNTHENVMAAAAQRLDELHSEIVDAEVNLKATTEAYEELSQKMINLRNTAKQMAG